MDDFPIFFLLYLVWSKNLDWQCGKPDVCQEGWSNLRVLVHFEKYMSGFVYSVKNKILDNLCTFLCSNFRSRREMAPNTDLLYVPERSLDGSLPHFLLRNPTSAYFIHSTPKKTTSSARASVYITFIYGICVNDVVCTFLHHLHFHSINPEPFSSSRLPDWNQWGSKVFTDIKELSRLGEQRGAQGRPTCPAHVPWKTLGTGSRLDWAKPFLFMWFV